MRANLKVILAAMGIAVLMSPVMAEAREKANRHESGATGDTRPAVNDCIRTAFPQCSGGNWRRTRHIHKARAMHKSHGDLPHPL
jgi:hypothetical protein